MYRDIVHVCIVVSISQAVLFIFTMQHHLIAITMSINHVFFAVVHVQRSCDVLRYYTCLMQLLVCVAKSDFSHSHEALSYSTNSEIKHVLWLLFWYVM